MFCFDAFSCYLRCCCCYYEVFSLFNCMTSMLTYLHQCCVIIEFQHGCQVGITPPSASVYRLKSLFGFLNNEAIFSCKFHACVPWNMMQTQLELFRYLIDACEYKMGKNKNVNAHHKVFMKSLQMIASNSNSNEFFSQLDLFFYGHLFISLFQNALFVLFCFLSLFLLLFLGNINPFHMWLLMLFNKNVSLLA